MGRILALILALALYAATADAAPPAAASTAPLAVANTAAPRPHIVLLLADDLGWNEVGFHGGEIATPNLDRLAAQGARLEQLYAEPLCSPSRAALLTGRYPMRYGLQTGVVEPDARYGLPASERSLATALREAGYATALLGKWHLGSFDPSVGPLRHGFQHHYGNLLGWIDHFTHRRDGRLDWFRDGTALDEPGYTTELLRAEALRMLRAHDRAQPLFLFVAFDVPHTPLQAPETCRARGDEIHPSERSVRAAMITCLDAAVGAIVGELERREMRENTLILFASDNGAPLGAGQAGDNHPWRDGKGSIYEGGVRVPAFASWPGRIAAGRNDALLHFVDLYPTLLRLAGASLEQALPLDGRDAWPAIAAAGAPARDEVLIGMTQTYAALRRGNWKLLVRGRLPAYRLEAVKSELYDLAADPGERVDLRQQQPVLARDLLARLDDYAHAARAPLNQR